MGWSNSGWLSDQGGWYKNAGGSPSYANVGSLNDNGGGGNTLTLSSNIGTAAANRVVAIAVARQNTGAFTSVTVGGVACTNIGNVGGADIWYVAGASPGSGVQSIVITGANFETRSAVAWTLSNLVSTTPTVATGGTTTASFAGGVSVGDLVFASNDTSTSAQNFSSSTAAPSHTFDGAGNSGRGLFADWLIGSAATPFNATATGFNTVAAKWH